MLFVASQPIIDTREELINALIEAVEIKHISATWPM
jgi:hypothetical protein